MMLSILARLLATLALALPAADTGRAGPGSGANTSSSPAPEIVFPLRSVTPTTIDAAIASARSGLLANPGRRYVIRLPEGTFDLSSKGRGVAAIDVTKLDACPGGLVIRGSGMLKTVLIKNNDGIGVLGRDTSCVTIEQVTLKQARLEMTQATVVSVDKDAMVVDIPAGFPTFRDLAGVDPTRDRNGRSIRWLKHFEMIDGAPRIVGGEQATRWTTAEPVGSDGRRWRVLTGAPRPEGTKWQHGDLMAVTAKSGGQAYRFVKGHDIGFVGVRWLGDGRGKFRLVDRVTVRDSVIEPPPPIGGVPFLIASSGGGPQVGHAGDPLVTGIVIENNRFTRTGDDAIAMADASGIVRNNRISNATRGILIVGSGNVVLEGNVLDHAPVRKKATGGKSRRARPCGPDEDCRPPKR